MKRHLFNARAIASLASAALLITLWARSFNGLMYASRGKLVATSMEGAWTLSWQEVPGDKIVLSAPRGGWPNLLAFRCGARALPFGMPGKLYQLSAPYWPLVLITLVPPAAWLRARSRKRPTGRECAACGYDLRGSAARTCPECGATHAPVPP